ncbi:putative leader peptide [Lentzea alba]|uniref:putative leader peptide n=1 Tax=Lentzea alba TaxID=2714351 RepID=UPI0036F27BBF
MAVSSQALCLSVTDTSRSETSLGCQLPLVNPSIRLAVDHALDARHTEVMHSTGVRLVARRHVDFRRVSSAMCRRSA